MHPPEVHGRRSPCRNTDWRRSRSRPVRHPHVRVAPSQLGPRFPGFCLKGLVFLRGKLRGGKFVPSVRMTGWPRSRPRPVSPICITTGRGRFLASRTARFPIGFWVFSVSSMARSMAPASTPRWTLSSRFCRAQSRPKVFRVSGSGHTKEGRSGRPVFARERPPFRSAGLRYSR